MKSRRIGKPSWQKTKRWLLGLLLAFMLMASGCGSNSRMPECAQSQVVVDPTLMVAPSYQTELLNFLSDKPEEPTSK